MSKHEALSRFHDWCAARRRKAETSRLRRSRVMPAQRSPLTTVLIRSGSCAEGGSRLRHPPLTYRIVEEI